MTIVHDPVKGWSEHKGEPRWRANTTALNRIAGADVLWRNGTAALPVHVAHLANGVAVCVIRGHPAHRRWSVAIEGFEFLQDVVVMGRTMWAGPVGFDRLAAARSFAETVLRQAGAATIKRQPHPKRT